MNDDDIRDLFKSFEPEISDGDDFIGRLQRNLDSVEMVKARNESFHRSNRVAAAVAAMAGFVAGGLMTAGVPWLKGILGQVCVRVGGAQMVSGWHDINTVIAWVVVASAAVVTSVSAYEICMSSVRRKCVVR